MVILAITGFNETAGSVDIRTRLKYSNTSSTTASSRMDTITFWVVEEGLNVRSREVLEKSIPAALRDKNISYNIFKLTWNSSRPTNSYAINCVQGYNDVSGQSSK